MTENQKDEMPDKVMQKTGGLVQLNASFLVSTSIDQYRAKGSSQAYPAKIKVTFLENQPNGARKDVATLKIPLSTPEEELRGLFAAKAWEDVWKNVAELKKGVVPA